MNDVLSRPVWQFLKAERSSMFHDPTEREFFLPEEGFAGALVREAIQNSLDARVGADPVVVRFAFGALSPETRDEYLAGLEPHLDAQKITIPDSALTYLVVEDFWTRGLHGDPSLSILEEQQGLATGKNDFFYFWRNIGRSKKEETERGRWGLGKTVFSASSKINSFFGLTVRSNDHRRLLMGQSVGVIHSLMRDEALQVYHPYGYWADFSDDGFALPSENPDLIAAFSSSFMLKRGDASGLSVVIPYPLDELSGNAILRETIRNYYFPILSGDLAVAVTFDGESYRVDASSVREVVGFVDWTGMNIDAQQMLALLDFASSVRAMPNADLLALKSGRSDKSPNINEERFEPADLEAAQAKFEAGGLVGMRVPVFVKKGATTTGSYFDAFLQRDASLSHGIGEFVREGLTISQGGKPPRGNVRGLVLVEDKALSTLLGDSENPSHTRWLERAKKIKPYHFGPSTIRIVVQSLPKLAELISSPPEEMIADLLVDTFYIELPPETEDEDSDDGPGKKPGGGKSDPPVPPITPPPPGPVSLTISQGGFRITGGEGEAVPERIYVDVAYAVRRGNPFLKYEAYDFDLSAAPIEISYEGASPGVVARNRLEIKPNGGSFAVKVAGFDLNRDLEVRVKHSMPGDV